MKINFDISDFCIEDGDIPPHVADKILRHIEIIQPIRNIMQKPIWPSMKSGYRSVSYEDRHKRSGNSEHTFKGRGAVDWTTRPQHLDEPLSLLKQSRYNRVCYYPRNRFIHCDFKGNEKQFFICENGGEWIRK